MIPNQAHNAELAKQAIVGQIGLVLLAIGMVIATFSPIRGTLPRIGLALAAISFGIAALSIGAGTLQLNSAFRSLAMAMTAEHVTFLNEVRPSKTPLLFGWSCLLFASTMVFVSIAVSAKPDRSATSSTWIRPSFVLSILSLLLILSAVVWNVTSLENLRNSLSDNPIEPTVIAGGVMGMIQSVLVSLIAVFGWAIACVLMAISAPERENTDLG